jgi:hypothetical protein
VILPLFAGIFYLQLVPAAWMVSVGFLFLGRLPGGDPPAWTSGVACPWPSPAEVRAAKEGTGADMPATATAGTDVAPAPSANGRSSRKRRRKRGARN